MNWTNYHTHSRYCDGTSVLRDYIEEAITRKMYALGFSGHGPVPFGSDWNMDFTKLNKYLHEIEELKVEYANRIKINTGIEIDFIDEVVGVNALNGYPVEYTIGSVHYLPYHNAYGDIEFWNFDSGFDIFDQGVVSIYNGDIQKAITQYFYAIQKMVRNQPPTIVGHLDLVKKFNRSNKYFCEEDGWYRDLIVETLNIIAQTNCIVEINTSSVLKSYSTEFYPSNWIIAQMKQLNIPVTINADAHAPNQLTNCHPQAALLLKQIGYESIAVFDTARWKLVDYTEKGLIVE